MLVPPNMPHTLRRPPGARPRPQAPGKAAADARHKGREGCHLWAVTGRPRILRKGTLPAAGHRWTSNSRRFREPRRESCQQASPTGFSNGPHPQRRSVTGGLTQWPSSVVVSLGPTPPRLCTRPGSSATPPAAHQIATGSASSLGSSAGESLGSSPWPLVPGSSKALARTFASRLRQREFPPGPAGSARPQQDAFRKGPSRRVALLQGLLLQAPLRTGRPTRRANAPIRSQAAGPATTSPTAKDTSATPPRQSASSGGPWPSFSTPWLTTVPLGPL